MEITQGKKIKALKVCIYGVEGVGKSTFAAQFPNSLFIDTENSTDNLDVKRFKRPSSWTMLLDQIEHVKKNLSLCETLVIDTADWAERLGVEHICDKAKITGIEDFGYGKGYVYLEEEFGRLLNKLQDLIELGINIVVTAHAEIKKIEQPEEIGGYDHWQMKLEKKTMQLLKEWTDILLFAKFKTIVVNVDNQGALKGKNKAQGGSRVMYTNHTPWWDAKNRHELPDELPLSFESIKHCFAGNKKEKENPKEEIKKTEAKTETENKKPETITPEEFGLSLNDSDLLPDDLSNLPKALSDLMTENSVLISEIQSVVAKRGYYPKDTPVENYDPQFISGVLVAAWDQVFEMIKQYRLTEF